MKILQSSNAAEVLETAKPGLSLSRNREVSSLSQSGIKKITMYKTHYFSLGEFARSVEVTGSSKPFPNPWMRMLPVGPYYYDAVHTYSLEVSLWKVAALVVSLVVILPIHFIKRIFDSTAAIFLKDTTEKGIDIQISKEDTGKVSVAMLVAKSWFG